MITLEGWSYIMYNLIDTNANYSEFFWVLIFCVLIIILGSFFLLNVVLAVILDSFEKVDK